MRAQIIKRDRYLDKLIRRRDNGMIKVITGLRRSGKSFLLFKLFKQYLIDDGIRADHIIEAILDYDENAALRDPAVLSSFIKDAIKNDSEEYIVLIDEAQMAITQDEMRSQENVRLYGILNSLMGRDNIDIYVTGSNSKFLSKDVMTVFRGRGDEVYVSPLSFAEYYEYVGGDITDAYEEYALYGGLPMVLHYDEDEDKTHYLKNLFEEVYFKDISERYAIRLPAVMGDIVDTLCSSIGSLTNASSLARAIHSKKNVKIDSETVSSYLDCLQDAFIFHEAKRYDVRGKRYFSYPSKYYCTDIGLRNARLNFRQVEESHIMENIIYNDLIARGYAVDIGVVEASSKNQGALQKQAQEIDFVVNTGPQKIYIQAALNIDDARKAATELRPLHYTGDFCRRIIITKTRARKWTDEDGIEHVGVYEFLTGSTI